MAKSKNKKKLLSEIIHAKKANARKNTLNPFEVHINKEKIRILGKKQKNDKGLPGVSRAKAIQKRKTTLLQEYKLQNKSNQFNDKRIGERNHNLTTEDKNIARFTAVRVNVHKKKSIFNLADDEVLTHRGQALTEIEKFDDPRSDDDSLDENETGNLGSDLVEAHFGGGLLKKTEKEGAETHKDIIQQLIMESKKRKIEQQKIREATLDLTEQLNNEWKDLIPLVSQKKNKDCDNQTTEQDDYDKLLRELKFSARGTVSDRLKTEDEIAKEEKAELEKLEQERLLRMNANIEDSKAHLNHRSADDIDDTFFENVDDILLSYDEEGKSNIQVDSNSKTSEEEVVDEIDPDNKVSDEDGSVGSTTDENTDSEDSLSDLKNNLSDDESLRNGSVDVTTNMKKNESAVLPDKIIQTHTPSQGIISDVSSKRKVEVEQAMKELCYTYTLPESYESLQELLENKPSVHQSIIIERMMKCNHQSLAQGNKEKLGLLFAYLLQYLNDKFEECLDTSNLKEGLEVFQELILRIYELAHINPENAHHSLIEVIKEKHSDYLKKPKKYPGFEVLIFFKIVSILLPTSDFRHQVVTPCLIFMEQLLTKCKVSCKSDISYGLFIVTLVLEYTSLSNKILPAAINFLSGIIHMAIPKSGVKLIKVLPPFKATSSQLVLLENLSSDESGGNIKMDCSCLLNEEIDDNFKVRVLYTSLNLLEEFHRHLQNLPSCVEIFNPILKYLEGIPMNNYPKLVKNVNYKLQKILNESKDQRKLEYLVMRAMKPKALRLYDPKIEEVFERRGRKIQSKTKAERDKLVHKLRKEKKGALREIRRDKDFLGRVKVQQQIISDKERREKVKRIYAEAASQQSELNALDRKKKRKK